MNKRNKALPTAHNKSPTDYNKYFTDYKNINHKIITKGDFYANKK